MNFLAATAPKVSSSVPGVLGVLIILAVEKFSFLILFLTFSLSTFVVFTFLYSE